MSALWIVFGLIAAWTFAVVGFLFYVVTHGGRPLFAPYEEDER